jgi:protocatechuate 3,4-dioxygenase beta subunit
MRSSTRQATACIFVIFSVAVIAHAQTTPAKELGATITGKVTIKGKGAPGVIVTLRTNEMSSSGRQFSGPKGVTDDEGNYRIINVPAGSYRAIPVAKTFVPAEEADREKVIIVNKNDTIDHIDFALVRGGVITGKVVDADGRPMVEEWVSAFSVPDNNLVHQPINSSTDDRGVYRIYGLRAGRYRVAAGRGEDSFYGRLPSPYRRTYHPAASDPSQATVVEVTEGGETRDVDITFIRTVSTYTASGRIVDGETGEPVPNVRYGVTRYEEKGSSSMSGGALTNSRGEYKLANLSPGKYAVSVLLDPSRDWRAEETRFEITDHDVTNLVIKTIKSGSISGLVVFEGMDERAAREQLVGTWIMASIEGSAERSGSGSARVGEDGRFHITGMAGGTANFYLHSNESIRIDRIERDGVIQPRGIVLKEREHITGVRVIAQFGNASLRGKIEVENGTLPPDGRLYVWARRIGDDLTMRSSGSNIRPQVDARGQFVIEGMTAGTYEIDAGVYLSTAKLVYRAKRQQVVVTAGATTTLNLSVDLSATPTTQP